MAHIPHIYNNIIQANSNNYNITIEVLLDLLKQECDTDGYYEGPIREPGELNINTIMMGFDNNYYIVRTNSNQKYWHKIVK